MGQRQSIYECLYKLGFRIALRASFILLLLDFRIRIQNPKGIHITAIGALLSCGLVGCSYHTGKGMLSNDSMLVRLGAWKCEFRLGVKV